MDSGRRSLGGIRSGRGWNIYRALLVEGVTVPPPLRSRMDGVPRRAFCSLLAASLGTASGCELVRQESSTDPWKPYAENEIVTTRRGLEAAFDDLAPGDTIRISARDAPYRTTEWLDIDVDGVTVIGPGVRDLIKPADGANVGGIRIGHNKRCRGVTLRRLGYHGNPDGQSETAERLHGIAVRNATDMRIEHNRIRNTHPRKHGNGGSGISVTRRCSDVWILNNHVDGYGDRGVQLGGRRLVVQGNAIRNGLDRPIACDLWYSSRENHTAQSVLIVGNVLGNAVEGSLVGIARNTPLVSNEGYVSIFGNLGFGSHKSFCHIRGPEVLRNISVQNNVSVQEIDRLQTERTEQFAGIAIDVAKGRNVTIKNNELHDYSGHGIHVNSEISDVTVQHNDISECGLAGIRLVGANDGVIDGNVVTRAGEAGIRLERASTVSVRGNCIRRTGTAGIVSGGSKAATGNDIANNYIAGSGGTAARPIPAILVGDTGARVRGNTIHGNGAPAIAESEGAGDNLYENNWSDGEGAWRITTPTSRVRNNTPPIDVHHGVSADARGSVVRVDFDKPYARRPRLTFGRIGGGIRGISYETDEDGDYVGAAITVEEEDATLDVFVDAV